MRTNYLLLLTCLGFISCSSFHRFQPAGSQPDFTTVRYLYGVPALRSQLNGADVTVDLSARGNRNMSLNLSISNVGLQPFDFLPENVRVSGYNAAGKQIPFRVLSAEQFIRRQRNRDLVVAGVALAVTAVAVASAIDDHNNAGQDDTYDYTDAELIYTAATIPVLAAEAALVNNAVHQPPLTPADGLLRRHTLYPGETLQGVVKMDARAGFLNKILVEVPVGDGYAPFVFEYGGKVR